MPDAAALGAGLVVRVGGVRWFVPVAAVIEVLRDTPVARVPAADPSVVGLVNHRGRILTVGDAARALALANDVGPRRDLVVVESGEGRRFAVAVEAVIELAPTARTGLATLDLEAIATAIFA